jgi:hypothetical protein
MLPSSGTRQWPPHELVQAMAAAFIAWLWLAQSTGIVSSNDGSHFALGRALAIHHRVSLGDEDALTLHVDWAQRDGEAYSDRAAGTAVLAALAIFLGNAADPTFLAYSRQRGELVVAPASTPYLYTYAKRFPKAAPLAKRLASALAITLHSVAIGLLGWWLWQKIAVRMGLTPGIALVSASLLCTATLVGPYATCLFSHATLVTVFLAWIYTHFHWQDSRMAAMNHGLCSGLAFAVEPSIALLLLPWFIVLRHKAFDGNTKSSIDAKWTRWIFLGAGTMIPLALVAAYNSAAFGAPWLIGYDFNANFAFAQNRGDTFDGSLAAGLVALLGPSATTSLIVQSPILGLALFGYWHRPQSPLRPDQVRFASLPFWGLFASIPWVLLLAMHHTPTGGQSQDARYILALVPILGFGLGFTLQRLASLPRLRKWCAGVLVAALTALSFWRTWDHFLAQHEGEWFKQAQMATWVVATGLFLLSLVYLIRRALHRHR